MSRWVSSDVPLPNPTADAENRRLSYGSCGTSCLLPAEFSGKKSNTRNRKNWRQGYKLNIAKENWIIYDIQYAKNRVCPTDTQNENPSRLSRCLGRRDQSKQLLISNKHREKKAFLERQDHRIKSTITYLIQKALNEVWNQHARSCTISPKMSCERSHGVLLCRFRAWAGKKLLLIELCIAIAAASKAAAMAMRKGKALYVNPWLDRAARLRRFRMHVNGGLLQITAK